MTRRRKLIEVDIPLDTINLESARGRSSRQGHPSALHQYWARRPLPSCRAVIFASLVDDPGDCPEEFPTKSAQRAERERLHKLIEQLVVWENVQPDSPGSVLQEARREIARSAARGRGEAAPTDPEAVLAYIRKHVPPLHDPFAGGGSIPLEAQRLGLRAIASDLNPLAVLINKALIELPPKFRNQPSINPSADPLGRTAGSGRRRRLVAWRGAGGLADDIRYYGRWMRDEAQKRIGHLYPKIELPRGGEATVTAWLWARTVPCPNPACGVRMPLIRSFQLSRRANKHWTRPVVDRDAKNITFVVQNHSVDVPDRGTVSRHGVTCLACQTATQLAYVREQGKAGNLAEQMTAVVAEVGRTRVFLSPDDEHIRVARVARPKWKPRGTLPEKALGFRVQAYGFAEWHQLFTQRQLVKLTTLCDLLAEARSVVVQDGSGDEYADCIHTFLALAIGKSTNLSCAFTRWRNDSQAVEGLFSRQAISMIWDFAELNQLSAPTRNWQDQVDGIANTVEKLPTDSDYGASYQLDAARSHRNSTRTFFVTDPPYYDNIGYADLSDFFYVWLRPLLRSSYPELFSGILTPKTDEMVAVPSRFKDPRQRFEDLLGQALRRIRESVCREFPVSIFYAYRQQEEMREGRASTGWETMLNGVVSAGFQIVGTWPMHTEMSTRQRAHGSNALASSVVLVCRPRGASTPVASRRQFLEQLETELHAALDQLTREGHIAPTDLAQAAIGPGMQVYSRYSRVETISGDQVTVREALGEINRFIDAYEVRQEGELDSRSRFCLRWLRQHGLREGTFGEAEVMSQATNVAIASLASEGLLTALGGVVRLLPLEDYHRQRELPGTPLTAWEGCHRMAWHMNREDGRLVEGAAEVARVMAGDLEMVERLARLLYSHYDRAGDSANAVVFNNLVTAWPAILEEAQRQSAEPSQAMLSLGGSS